MTASAPIDRPSSSLSDSWAELSNSDFQSEDDAHSEQTDKASLVGQNGPDDVSSLDEGDSSEADEKDLTSDCSASQELSHPECIGNQASEDGHSSAVTTKSAHQVHPESIEFEEPESWPDAEQVELKHTIQIFDEEESSEILQHLPSELIANQLVATVRQTMTKQSLTLQRPFRVLYIGDAEARHHILDKIGDALVASANAGDTSSGDSSRYHVVPTSFGAGATSNFAELLPIHVQLVVDECISATSVRKDDSPDIITLSFKSRAQCHSRWAATHYTVASPTDWTDPDISIFFLSDKDDISARRTRRFAHAFMNRHDIPTIIVSEKPLWGRPAEAIPLDYQSVHMCLESRASNTVESRVLKRLPIDLKTLESIAPGQMNRNLACLTGLYAEKIHPKPQILKQEATETKGRESPQDIEKYPTNTFTPGESISSFDKILVIRTLVATIVCLGMVLVLQYFARSSTTPAFAPSTSNPIIKPVTTVLSSSASFNTISTAVTSLPTESIALPNSIATVHEKLDLAQILIHPALESWNRSEKFQVQVIGDCHIILKPPQRFATMKKPPKFSVTVTRNEGVLPHQLSKLFDGVYTVKLDRADAYGPVNVSVTTRSKPVVHQVSEVDFGSPWLKIAGWKNAARVVSAQLRKDLENAQTNLGILYERLSTDMQIWKEDAVKKADVVRREAEIIQAKSLQQALRTTDVVMAKSREISAAAFKHGAVASKQLSHQMAVASKSLSAQTRAVNKEIGVLADEAWRSASRNAANLRLAASKLDVNSLKDKLQKAKKSQSLAMAQERAFRLLRESQGRKAKAFKDASHASTPKKARKGKCSQRCNR